MKVITLSLLFAIFTFAFANAPIALLSSDEVLNKALKTGLTFASSLGYDQEGKAQLYTGGPIFVEDLVNINPYAYGQLYAEVFQSEEIIQANLLNELSQDSWASLFATRRLTDTTARAVNDIVARYSGYYEVPIYHAQEGCAMQVRFMAAQKSNWQTAELCTEQTMLTPLDIQQLTGLTDEPRLVTFEHTDTGWGKMWLIGSVAVQPYNGEVYVVTTREGVIVNPLITNIPLEYADSAKIGRYGPVAQRSYNLPVQLRPLSYLQISQ